MRKFKVISLAVSGNRNKIFRTHDVVEERQVHDADDLVARKHLIEIDATPQEETPDPPVIDPEDGKVDENVNEADVVSRETNESTSDAESTTEPTEETEPVKEPEPKVDIVDVPAPAPGMDDIETADIKKQLKERGVTFNKNASKEDLYRLFIGL